jgi:hypothetical protein
MGIAATHQDSPNMKEIIVPAIGCIWLLTSCANVTFHPAVANGMAPNLSKQTGLKYYTAKPYLLVGPTGNKDAPFKAEIISLPDLENPTYAVYHPGWGQHIFSLAVSSNGNLSSYGQTADSKIPETIAAVGSLMSGGGALATAVKGLLAASTPRELVQRAIKQLDDLKNLDQTDPVVRQKVDDAFKLKARLGDMSEKYTEEGLAAVSKDIEKLKFQTPQGPTQSGVNEYLNGAKGNIDAAIEALKPASSKKVRLYEIKMEGGVTKLVEVPIPPEIQ